MSDNWLRFVPADPQYLPSPEAANNARNLLAAFTQHADAVTAKFKESVEFFDPGGNWSGVCCHICGADAEPWWQAVMDTAWDTHFSNLTVIASCCGASVSLNELRYVWPAGFARFVLEAMNPNISDLTAAEQGMLQETLGCPLRRIWVHI
jgi:hypothetical protein